MDTFVLLYGQFWLKNGQYLIMLVRNLVENWTNYFSPRYLAIHLCAAL